MIKLSIKPIIITLSTIIPILVVDYTTKLVQVNKLDIRAGVFYFIISIVGAIALNIWVYHKNKIVPPTVF